MLSIRHSLNVNPPPVDQPPLSLLERAALRKAAQDAGFDMLDNLPRAVRCRSSHAPLMAWVTPAALSPVSPTSAPGQPSSPGQVVVALAMPTVVHALGPVPEGAQALTTSSDAELIALAAQALEAPVDAIAGWFRVYSPRQLERLLRRSWDLSRSLPNALEKRFEVAVQTASSTEREATVRQRIGQNLFREGLMALWGGRCAITKLAVPELLRASHAKAWADATDAERLDVFNGLLLAAHLDAAFDAGLICVSAEGQVACSPRLPDQAKALLGLDAVLTVPLMPAHEPYLAWHRQKVFQAG